MLLIYLVIGASIVSVIYLALGGRAMFRAKEKPQKLLAKKVLFFEIDGLGAEPPEFPTAVVSSFSNNSYRVDFTEPLEVEGQIENHATITARHIGYPVSNAPTSNTGVLAVNGTLQSNQPFMARVRRVK
jgi:hypothetical protein